MAGLWNRLLDRSVFFSFDRSGYERHARSFDASAHPAAIAGRVVLVTGANSGLGRATSEALARAGAELHMLCRNRERGERAVAEVRAESGNADVHLRLLDVSDLAAVRRFCADDAPDRIDRLVHNAGALVDERAESVDGIEVTLATHVVGPHLMTSLLLPRLQRSDDARVITVSSGGMYGARLQLDDMQWTARPFNGVTAYAEAKRAQVTLNGMWPSRPEAAGVRFFAMHPGWAATPGVETALPRFWKLMQKRLRSPAEGSDTIVWLSSSSALHQADNGSFWFDRQVAPVHLRGRTRERPEERQELWQRVERLADGQRDEEETT